MKEILQKSGFDKPEYLFGLTELQLSHLEENIDQDRTIFESVETQCVHKEVYKASRKFKFLPGHRILILNFSQSPPKTDTNPRTNHSFEHPAFSILLQNMIQTALNNYENSPTNNRYPELLMDFAIYIYIMAGKACYEVIAANLPIPSAHTICNINYHLLN